MDLDIGIHTNLGGVIHLFWHCSHSSGSSHLLGNIWLLLVVVRKDREGKGKEEEEEKEKNLVIGLCKQFGGWEVPFLLLPFLLLQRMKSVMKRK